MRALLSVDEMMRLDRETMLKLSLSSFQLMDRVSDEMFAIFQKEKECSGTVLMLCGPGNNGGDAYRLAEKLRNVGRKVWCLEVLPPSSKDCVEAKKLFRGEFVKAIPKSVDVVVDGIFGLNGRADLSSSISKLLTDVNKMKAFRVALDISSGVDGESGRVSENTFLADLTLVVAYPKKVFILESVAQTLGRIILIADFFCLPTGGNIFAIEDSDFISTRRSMSGHKGNYGRCGVVGGTSNTPGAPMMSAEAAHRVGAGYVTLFFAKSKGLRLKMKEASFLFREKWKVADLKRETALVIGVGGVPEKFKYSALTCPAVVDADALNDWKKIKTVKGFQILTPHPGEAAGILKTHTRDIQKDRVAALRELVLKTEKAVYLKGAPGLLVFPESPHKYYVNLSMNPTFSKAGSGDILSGILGGFLAQTKLVTEQGKGEGFQAFNRAILSGLVFQRVVGEILRSKQASIATDQLDVFSEAFERLGVR